MISASQEFCWNFVQGNIVLKNKEEEPCIATMVDNSSPWTMAHKTIQILTTVFVIMTLYLLYEKIVTKLRLSRNTFPLLS